jgi:Amt family ammonium transporter
LITVHWTVFGYTFSFGPGSKGYGNFKWVGLRDVGQEPNPDYAATIPHLVYMAYQMMFAIITPVSLKKRARERKRGRIVL